MRYESVRCTYPCINESSTTLVTHSMQHVLLKFELCHPVVLDDGTPFKGTFITMCQALNLNYDILAKQNHKGMYVDYFRRF